MHAWHRLEVRFRIGAVALVVRIDAQPVHVASAIHLLFADDSDIVLRLAGDDAIVATNASIQVNRHAPGVGLLRVVEAGIERQLLRWLFFFGEVRLAVIFVERCSLNQRTLGAIGSFYRLISLS